MPYPKDHAAKSREKILGAAYKHFIWRGYEAASIDDIMRDCQMTRGAFYRHFDSKAHLYRDAIAHGARQSKLNGDKPRELNEKSWLRSLLASYLDKDTSAKTEWPCPLAFFVSDVAHQDPIVRGTYAQAYAAMNTNLHELVKTYSGCSESTVLAVTAMLIGAVALARTIDDDGLRNRLLDACEQMALQQLTLG